MSHATMKTSHPQMRSYGLKDGTRRYLAHYRAPEGRYINQLVFHSFKEPKGWIAELEQRKSLNLFIPNKAGKMLVASLWEPFYEMKKRAWNDLRMYR